MKKIRIIQENSIPLALIVLSSLALFGAFKAGQALGRNSTLDSLHDLTLNRVKQKTESRLSMLLNEYKGTNPDFEVPEERNVKDILDLFVSMDPTIPEKILGLNKIYLDLVNQGAQSEYFLLLLQFLGG